VAVALISSSVGMFSDRNRSLDRLCTSSILQVVLYNYERTHLTWRI
jgi:hypothetical protein